MDGNKVFVEQIKLSSMIVAPVKSFFSCYEKIRIVTCVAFLKIGNAASSNGYGNAGLSQLRYEGFITFLIYDIVVIKKGDVASSCSFQAFIKQVGAPIYAGRHFDRKRARDFSLWPKNVSNNSVNGFNKVRVG